ncbi:type 4a pilus biogenesis protein PilO [Patescibacteria group bacterium]|nr:type 4a pilus biogenesis protein PilO [Patescibacteria group bacterium]
MPTNKEFQDFKKWILKNAGIGAAVLAVLLVVLFVLGGDISGRVASIQEKRQTLIDRVEALNSLADLRTGSEKANALLPKLQESLPTTDQLIGFSDYLQTTAQQNNLTFAFSFTDEIPGNDTTPSTNDFIVTLTGQYTDFLAFLKEIEASKYFIGVTSVDVTARQSGYDMLLKGKVFAQ